MLYYKNILMYSYTSPKKERPILLVANIPHPDAI